MVMVFTHEKTIRLCDRIPGSALCVSTLWPLALLGSWVSGPWVVALGRGVTADSRVLLADAIVLASMPTPEKKKKYQLAHYKHSCMHIFVREWPEAVFKHVKTHNPVRLNSPPAWSLLIVGDGGSHGRVGHHGLAGVVDGHAGHLLPRGRDEDLLCACWPALLFTHTHKPINTCLNTTVQQLSQERL